MIDIIDGEQFRNMIRYGAAAIQAEKQSINDLNVFPVPDGDTGTNMSLTIGAAVTALAEKQADTVGQAASVTASALLRGARGNSGVILSLLFRGISRQVKDKATMDGVDFAAALSEGVSAAYGAVMKPAEGTILTVSRLAAERAAEASMEDTSFQFVLEKTIERGEEALADTVNQNPVLKKAGVVDAGGKGFLVILMGMLSCLKGEPIAAGAEAPSQPTKQKADFTEFDVQDTTFAFDTVYIVRKAKPGDRRGRRVLQGARPHEHPRRGADRVPEVWHAGAGQDRKHAHSDRGSGRRPQGADHRRSGGHRSRTGGHGADSRRT